MANAIYGMDLTVKAEGTTKEAVEKWLRSHCKRWVFQLEKGESGFVHFQCRFSLKTKERVSGVGKRLQEAGLVGHLSPTSGGVFGEDDVDYVMKTDTRIEGPWSDQDAVVPSDMRALPVWNPLQERILHVLRQAPNRRTITCVVDPVGNRGKSFLATWLFCHKKAVYIPFFTEAKDLMRMVFGMPKWGAYIIDLPRALSHKAQHEIYAGIEQLKTGIIYEDRYHFRMEAIEPCHVVVFTNRKPDLDLVSRDRWHFIVLGEDDILPGAGAAL